MYIENLIGHSMDHAIFRLFNGYCCYRNGKYKSNKDNKKKKKTNGGLHRSETISICLPRIFFKYIMIFTVYYEAH